jgi:hypothetical protein
MTTEGTIFFSALMLLSAALSFYLGRSLECDEWRKRATFTRLEASQAEREMIEIERQAFIAMAEAAMQCKTDDE